MYVLNSFNLRARCRKMPLLGARMRRYVSCSCLTSASDGVESSTCEDLLCTTCGPLARRPRGLEKMSDVEAWLDDLSIYADCDTSRSLVEKNDELNEDLKEDETSEAGDLQRSMSELSLHVSVNSVICTSSSSSRDVTEHRHSISDTGGNMTSSSGYEAGTRWSRDDDVIPCSDEDDVRVSWSDSTGSSQSPIVRLYHLSPLRIAGRPVYVIESERLALTSLPVMSPEVVRCVWDEHRRLRHRRVMPPVRLPCRLTSGPPEASRNHQLCTRNFEVGTRDLGKGHLRHLERDYCRHRAPTSNNDQTYNPDENSRKLPDAAVRYRQQTSTPHYWNIESPTMRGHVGHHLTIDDLSPLYCTDRNPPPGQRCLETREKVVGQSQMAFFGVELVDWLQCRVERLRLRCDAVNYAQQLLHDELIYRVDGGPGHCRDMAELFDECSMYAFTAEPCQMRRENWPQGLRPNAI